MEGIKISDLIFYLIPGIIITAFSPVMFFVKMNYFVGFRTTDTPSDPKV
ncbi:MAG TPA: hypothetical protein PLW79_03425 [Caldisericia bacterium]|nr:hypothetical protein [Caldisericia bacterium]HOL83578.1 hypothetical protein [Caldisericia bacterium]